MFHPHRFPAAVVAVLVAALSAASPAGAAGTVDPRDGTRALRRGDALRLDGQYRAARKRWLKALDAGGDVAAGARRRLRQLSDEQTFPDWTRTVSPHFILYADPDTLPSREARPFLERREQVYAELVARLGTEVDGPIHIYAYASDRQARLLTGRTLAFAEPERREIHIRPDQEPGHEEAHVLAWTWNRQGSGVPLLEEGLSVALSAHPGSPHASAAETLARDRLPSLDELIARFRSYENGYPLAGSFVSMLMDSHGIEALKALYVGGNNDDFPERLEAITGESLAALQRRWETLLAAQASASREDVLEAVSLVGLGRLDEAIARLERQRREKPGNGVVEFVLAQALRDRGDLEASAAAYRRVLDAAMSHRLAWIQESARHALEEMEP